MPAIDPLDWIYPPICALCGEGSVGRNSLCESCCLEMPRIAPPFCDVCGEHFKGQIDGDFSCPNCMGLSFHFEFARAAMDRSESMLELIHRLKYGREIHLAGDLGKVACEVFSSDRRLGVALGENWPLVPVPLHRMRLMDRQFNQAEEIARGISLITELPVARLLRRVRRTETQTRLSRNQRMANLKGAFSVRKTPGGVPPGVILVDDVFTTGSTVDECAKVLRRAGAERVAVLTVMRG